MANCPKCGVKLKLTDIKPTCPKCGINLIYYGMEERLLEDADRAESEHARTQKVIDRVKASFAGSKLAIVRIVLSILPIAALMLPLANVSFWGPYFEKSTAVNAITIYNVVSSLDFNALIKYISSDFFGSTFILYAVSLIAILLAAVLLVVNLVCLAFSCTPKGFKRSITLNAIKIVLAVVSMVTFILFANKLNAIFPTVFNGSIGFGAFIFIATLIALLVINIVISKKGIPVKYKQTYVGGIPSEKYFEYLEQGMSTREIRKMMAENDAQKKVEVALKAKEEADALQAEADKLTEEAKQAEANGDSDASEKTQIAAKAMTEAAQKTMEAAALAKEAAMAMESLKQFNTPEENAAEAEKEEDKETVSSNN